MPVSFGVIGLRRPSSTGVGIGATLPPPPDSPPRPLGVDFPPDGAGVIKGLFASRLCVLGLYGFPFGAAILSAFSGVSFNSVFALPVVARFAGVAFAGR